MNNFIKTVRGSIILNLCFIDDFSLDYFVKIFIDILWSLGEDSSIGSISDSNTSEGINLLLNINKEEPK